MRRRRRRIRKWSLDLMIFMMTTEAAGVSLGGRDDGE
jgi:hypothetical protein